MADHTDNAVAEEWQVRIEQHANGARDLRAYYDALLSERFTEEQALAIVVAWTARPPGIDAPALFALVEKLKED